VSPSSFGSAAKQSGITGLLGTEDEGINTGVYSRQGVTSQKSCIFITKILLKISTSLFLVINVLEPMSESLLAAVISKEVKQPHYRTRQSLLLVDAESTPGSSCGRKDCVNEKLR